jgi:hypothetical protein
MMLGPYTLPFANTLTDANTVVSEFGGSAYAGVYRMSKRGLEIGDFTGARYKLPVDAMLFDIFGWRGNVKQAVAAFTMHLDKYIRPKVLRIFEEDHALKRALFEADWHYITSNVSPYAEVFGYYSQYEMPAVAPLSAAESWLLRPVKKEPFITQAERKAILKEADALGVEWADHYSNYNKNHTWSAYALRGYKRDDPTFIIKPSEMTAKWKKENGALAGLNRVYDTEAYEHFPTVRKVLARLPGGMFDRIRLMRLTGGGELLRHCDISDKDAGIANGKVARLHIPLVTSDDVEFYGLTHRGRASVITMQERHLYYLDQRKPHWVVNYDKELERIHLVIDIYSSERLRRMFENLGKRLTLANPLV